LFYSAYRFLLIRHFFIFCSPSFSILFFFFNDPSTTEIYTLSLHDALPIYQQHRSIEPKFRQPRTAQDDAAGDVHHVSRRNEITQDRKSTRLNSSHLVISYAVFCLKKKNHLSPLRLCLTINYTFDILTLYVP